MKIRLIALKTAVALCCAAAQVNAAEGDLELYMDPDSGQLFAQPGPGLQRLGTFRPVTPGEANAPADSAAAQMNEPAFPAPGAGQAERDADAPATETTAATTTTAPLTPANTAVTATNVPRPAHWTDSLRIRGYLQTRYTSMLSGDEGINLWSDRSVGDADSLGNADKNFLIRRARLVFQGDIGDRLSFYIQPDLASSAGSTGNVMQMRDAYADIYLDESRSHRLRVGQSKVPYGFENLQSSSNRLAPDRNDALNSGVRDERDLGVFYYYTPPDVQSRFDQISNLGLKHTGNYGMFALGVYNGQGANRGDQNDGLHTVARLSYPFMFENGQFIEASIQGYSGKYVPGTGAWRGPDDQPRAPALIDERYRNGYDDERVGLSFVLFPQPFGLQAEWNWGDTPVLDMATNTIIPGDLEGGYVQAMMKLDNAYGTFFPFLKWQHYDGANKAETNAPPNQVEDLELGVEWQFNPDLELTAVLHRMKRGNLVTGNRAGRPDYERFEANALRMQLQYNY